MKIAIFGDDDGEVQGAIEELTAHDNVLKGMQFHSPCDLAKLGMGARTQLPIQIEPDFLDGIVPWTGKRTH